MSVSDLELGKNDTDRQRYEANVRAEVDSAALYDALAEVEKDPAIAEVYRKLAASERAHADRWKSRLNALGVAPQVFAPSGRARALRWLARHFGASVVLPTLVEGEAVGASSYRAQPETAGSELPAEEQSHGRVLRAIAETAPGRVTGAGIARLEGRHRAVGGNALRAAVLGANDGLVSNLSLVMGVAGAEIAGHGIIVTGLAGLLAGAGSMALGEWISVESSRELYQRQLEIEREELEAAPAVEAEELALIYQSKGVAPEEARALADRVIATPATALDTLAREELAINPEELGGSPWEASITSFLLFATGAIIPVIPFFFLTGLAAVAVSVGVSALALFAIGAAITLVTGRSVWRSGARMLAFGLGAAGLTFALGRLIGASIGG